MCTILFAWQQDEQYPLVLAANRDEFYERPTQRVHWWEDQPHVYAGRDLKGGGTWMGANKYGFWAALTNYREVEGFIPDAPSRGPLVADYLVHSPEPQSYLESILPNASSYNGFNLLLGTPDEIWYYANRDGVTPQKLLPGFYGLSNRILDTPWPKVQSGKAGLKEIVSNHQSDPDALFQMLHNSEIAPDEQLPATGVSLEWERLLSARFIINDAYGTRVSTVIRQNIEKQLEYEERAFVPQGEPLKEIIEPKTINT
ncbi:MAG: NRDE family protein [Bacteroidota bacterium]